MFGYTGWKPTGGGALSRDGKRLAALRARATMGAGGRARGAWNAIQISRGHEPRVKPFARDHISEPAGVVVAHAHGVSPGRP